MAKATSKTNKTDRARATFLALLAESCNVTASCEAAGIGRATAYRWRDEDETFAAQWEEAEAAAADALEQVAFERAKAGLSDRMLEILLKAHKPKYREKQAVEITGKDGGPVEYREAAVAEVKEMFGPTPHLIENARG